MRWPSKHGEYIVLHWDGWLPDEVFVRGHVTDAVADEALAGHEGDDIRHGQWRHEYGRWSVEPREDGPGHVLRTYTERGRGRFAVTAADVTCKQVDPHSWQERRTGTRYDWRNRTTISNTKPGEECDCTVFRHEDCVCEGDCACHWSPRGPQAAWYRRVGAEGG